jgi:hypothetical protein
MAGTRITQLRPQHATGRRYGSFVRVAVSAPRRAVPTVTVALTAEPRHTLACEAAEPRVTLACAVAEQIVVEN